MAVSFFEETKKGPSVGKMGGGRDALEGSKAATAAAAASCSFLIPMDAQPCVRLVFLLNLKETKTCFVFVVKLFYNKVRLYQVSFARL